MSSQTRNIGKLTGFAIIALRATIKAIELNAGQNRSNGEYRYDIPKAGNGEVPTAKIFRVDNGQVVDGCEKALEEWAKDGKQIRLAFIGLKSEKIALEQSEDCGSVRYTLNALTGEAYLTSDGEKLAGKPNTIEEWAKVGREVEKPLFESLKAAQDYGSKDGEEETRAKMVALGIIRDPRAAGESQ